MQRMASRAFTALTCTRPKEFVVHVQLNRPQKRNAMDMNMWREVRECFEDLSTDSSCRAIVLSGAGKMFCSGIDVSDLGNTLVGAGDSTDPGRRAFALRNVVLSLQSSFTAIEKCPKPVLAAVHGNCIGAGVDMITACDMRYCSQDASFQVKEVDMGLAADVGTLQRLPKVLGNDSLVRELCLTAREMPAQEALSAGFVSRVYPDTSSLLDAVIGIAESIASKSPIAVQGTKVNLNYSRDHTVAESLDYMATWNASMLQSEDLQAAISAFMQKQKAVFAKL